MSSKEPIRDPTEVGLRRSVDDEIERVRVKRATISVEEAASILGVGRGTAYAGVREGWLPALRLGRRLVVPIVALEDLLHRANSRTTGLDTD
jgi:excisionase family DNA binding protein